MSPTDSIVTYQSSINPEFTVSIIFQDFENYDALKQILTNLNNSIGALIVGTKQIIIDGEAMIDFNLDRDALLCIEAHEIAHSILNHEPGVDLESEKEADVLALGLLRAHDFTRAAEKLEERIQSTY